MTFFSSAAIRSHSAHSLLLCRWVMRGQQTSPSVKTCPSPDKSVNALTLYFSPSWILKNKWLMCINYINCQISEITLQQHKLIHMLWVTTCKIGNHCLRMNSFQSTLIYACDLLGTILSEIRFTLWYSDMTFIF